MVKGSESSRLKSGVYAAISSSCLNTHAPQPGPLCLYGRKHHLKIFSLSHVHRGNYFCSTFEMQICSCYAFYSVTRLRHCINALIKVKPFIFDTNVETKTAFLVYRNNLLNLVPLKMTSNFPFLHSFTNEVNEVAAGNKEVAPPPVCVRKGDGARHLEERRRQTDAKEKDRRQKCDRD